MRFPKGCLRTYRTGVYALSDGAAIHFPRGVYALESGVYLAFSCVLLNLHLYISRAFVHTLKGRLFTPEESSQHFPRGRLCLFRKSVYVFSKERLFTPEESSLHCPRGRLCSFVRGF